MRAIIKYIILIPVLLITSNYTYMYSGLYNEDVKKCDGELVWAIDSLSAKKEILYFAESSNFTVAENDSSKETISEILNTVLKKNNISAINMSASHAGIYRTLIYRLKSTRTKTVIITMNLRSFGINWIESKLETNLSRTNIIYTTYPPIIKKLLLAFSAYDKKEPFKRERAIKSHYKHDVLFSEKGKFSTVRDWDAFMFSKGHLSTNGERDGAKCELACHFIKNYGFIINEDNPRVKDFDAIFNFCSENNIKIVLNLLPENCEKARELCGDDLIFLMNKNVEFLKKRYSSRSVFVNNLTLLNDSNFIDKLWPTEHYNFDGRRKVARAIADRLIKP